MKAFVSWSGGKDCMYALHRFLSDTENQVECLVNFCDADTLKSRSHGLDASLIKAQSEAMELQIIQEPLTTGFYEYHFREVVSRLKEKGVEAGVFGDIYLREHRDWIERVCGECGIKACFPLWGEQTTDLLQQFIADGYRTLIVAVKKEDRFRDLPGQIFNQTLYKTLESMHGVDPCGENGEYHTFVVDGPLFHYPLSYESGKVYETSDHYFLPVRLKVK
ncbi:MAG: diphthine--ammonia ligase [Bacteroidales bacterium]